MSNYDYQLLTKTKNETTDEITHKQIIITNYSLLIYQLLIL